MSVCDYYAELFTITLSLEETATVIASLIASNESNLAVKILKEKVKNDLRGCE